MVCCRRVGELNVGSGVDLDGSKVLAGVGSVRSQQADDPARVQAVLPSTDRR